MSGVACALELAAHGHHPCVFDTGKRGVGGRMATRCFTGAGLHFDHACQFFTATHPKFVQKCKAWQVLSGPGVGPVNAIVSALDCHKAISLCTPSAP